MAAQLNWAKRGVNVVWKFFGQEALFKSSSVTGSDASSSTEGNDRRQAFTNLATPSVDSSQLVEVDRNQESIPEPVLLQQSKSMHNLLNSLQPPPDTLEYFKGQDLDNESINTIVAIIQKTLSGLSPEEQVKTRTELEKILKELTLTAENLGYLDQHMKTVDSSISSQCQIIMKNCIYNYYMEPQKRALEICGNGDMDKLYIIITEAMQTAIDNKLSLFTARRDLQGILLKLNLTEDNLQYLTNKLQQNGSTVANTALLKEVGTIIKEVADVLKKQKADVIIPSINAVNLKFTSLGREEALKGIYSFIKKAINDKQRILTVTDFLEQLRTKNRELTLTNDDFKNLLKQAAQEFLGKKASISSEILKIYEKINVFLETIKVTGNPESNMHVREEDENGNIANKRASEYHDDLIKDIQQLQSQSTTDNSFNSIAFAILSFRLYDYASQKRIEGVTRTSQIGTELQASLHEDAKHFKQGLLKAPADDPISALTAVPAIDSVVSRRPPPPTKT